jgi:AcrR family transcriptional regulator
MACFARQGFRATSMEDIVQECALSVGAIYTYFPSKEDLFLALAEQHTQDVLYHINAIFSRPGPMAEKSREAVDYFFDQLEEDLVPLARVSREFWSEATKSERLQARQVEHVERVRQFYVWLLLESKRNGDLRDDVDVEAAAELMMALNEGILMLHGAGLRRVPVDALKAAYNAFLDHGLSGMPRPELVGVPSADGARSGHTSQTRPILHHSTGRAIGASASRPAISTLDTSLSGPSEVPRG